MSACGGFFESRHGFKHVTDQRLGRLRHYSIFAPGSSCLILIAGVFGICRFSAAIIASLCVVNAFTDVWKDVVISLTLPVMFWFKDVSSDCT